MSLRHFTLALFGATLVVGCGAPETSDLENGEGTPAPVTDDGSGDTVTASAYCDDVTTWNSTWASMESAVITEMNKRRAAGATCGTTYKPPVAALTANAKLRCAGRKHSRDMAVNNFFSHTGSNGSTAGQRITSAGYVWSGYGENIGAGYTTAAAVVTGWMNSSGHCSAIMNGNFRDVGIGYYYLSTNPSYKHYWTADFARP